MIAFAPWQTLLDALASVLAWIYGLIPNYGVTIIVLTVVIRLVLLPLGIKQVRSMQHMQLIQPKIKQIQQKYKQNKTKQQEEIMKLYKEYGVNPFSGCWPVLLQFPILIAMYSVMRFPQHPMHIPEGTELYAAVTAQIPIETEVDGEMVPITSQDQISSETPPPTGTAFIGMNLLCSASQAGNENATLGDTITVDGKSVQLQYAVDCGSTAVDRIPYYLFVVLMFGTTYYQQRQMQKASPPGAASSQQQALLRFMPIMFGVFGVFFPSGLVVYWTTSNAWQIGQQYFMLRSRPTAETLAARAAEKDSNKAQKKGFMGSMMARAEEERKRREAGGGRPGGGTSGRKPPPPRRPTGGKGKAKPREDHKPKAPPEDPSGTDTGDRPER